MLDLISRPRTLNDRIRSYLAQAGERDTRLRLPEPVRGVRCTAEVAGALRLDKTVTRSALNALADAGKVARHASILDSHTWRAAS